MKAKEYIPTEIAKRWLKKLWFSFIKRFPPKYQKPIACFVAVLLAVCVGGLFILSRYSEIRNVIQNVKGVGSVDVVTPSINNQQKSSSAILEKERVENKCRGAQFDIFSDYFESVGNERFYKEELGVSARNTDYYQATRKSNWACNMPFVAQVVTIPLSGSSFGLFFEYEDVFRVLVGDGDRVTLKVEQNKLNDRKREWLAVPDKDGNERQKLGNPIEDGEEVTLIVKTKESGGNIVLHIDVYHSKFQSVEQFDYVFSPNAINIQAPQSRNYRVGLNDFRFEGTGSIIDLKTLSVEEKEW